MWLNYLKITLRSFLRDKLFSFINVFGLAVGLCSVILIGLYVKGELSYDRFFPDVDRLYRISIDYFAVDGAPERHLASNGAAAAPLLTADFPQFEAVSRVVQSSGTVARDELLFFEQNIYYADPGVFRIFGLDWLQGDPQTALQETNSVVITASIARKYFGTTNALGQTLHVVSRDLKITGVIRDLPENSHMAPTMFAPIELLFLALGDIQRTTWLNNLHHTYVKLAPGIDMDAVSQQFPAFLNRHIAADASKTTGLSAMPVTDIHLRSARLQELKPAGSMATVMSLMAIASGILLIACFNFLNIATARSTLRGKEVGVRKSIGAQRKHLVLQYLGESLLMTQLATLLAIALVELVLPAFNGFSGRTLAFDLLHDGTLQVALLALVLVVGCLAGAYPAFYLSAFNPAQVLKSRITVGVGDVLLRNLLVILQFSISIMLVIATAVVMLQNRYVGNFDVGFNKEQVVMLSPPRSQGVTARWDTLKEQLLKNPDITQAAASNMVPGIIAGNALKVTTAGSDAVHEIGNTYVDYGFFETYGIKLLAGRLFSADFPADRVQIINDPAIPLTGNFIINAAAAHELGWTPQAAIGHDVRMISTDNILHTGRIVGVVADSNFESLHVKVRPRVFLTSAQGKWGRTPVFLYAGIRLGGEHLNETLAYIDSTWKSLIPEIPIARSFLDDNFDALYQDDQRLARLFSCFATLAILIACLGLFGLATFNAQRRIKEIGVRKVMGGSVWSIVWLLTNDFSKLVLIANLVAWPLAYYAMNVWLQNFAYRISLTPFIFIGSGLIALCIAWVTVGGTAAKAASARPVLALRYE